MRKPITARELPHFATALRAILGLAVETRDEIHKEALDLTKDGHDSQGDAGVDREFEDVDLDALDVEQTTAKAAVAALGRIQDGTYGRCMDCEQWIHRSRLEAMPHASRCFPCQEQSEADA